MSEPTPPTLTAGELEDRAAIAFLDRYLQDRASGQAAPLQHYLAQFPAFEARIAREWLALLGLLPADAGEPPTTVAPSGDRIGHYRLVRELGRGGQGAVYLAEDEKLGRRVALKVLPLGVRALSGQASLRLRREVEAIARLEHPGICTVYEAGADEHVAWIAMRLVDGESLAQRLLRLRERGRVPDRAGVLACVRIAQGIAEALAAAHAQGVVHRDVKPANVLLNSQDEPVVVDFGLARDEQGDTPTITLPGAVLGTLFYLPPERLEGRAHSDPRGDVWGLGATLYELLTLERPFQAATAEAETHAVLHSELRDPRRLNPAVSRDLAIVVATALEKDPDRRYASAADLAADLRAVLEVQPIRARPAGPLLRLWRFCQRNRALAASLAGLFGVLAAGLLVSLLLLNTTQRALADVTRLSDLKLAQELKTAAATLWPARAEKVTGPEGMDAWLLRSHALLGRRADHEQALARLGEPGTDQTRQWQREQLTALLAELTALNVLVADVLQRRDFAFHVRDRTLVAAKEKWDQAISAIRTSPHYGGLELRPQLGLLPLGPDPDSGLWEFAHVESGDPAQRRPDGKLLFGEPTGLVFVLIPGGKALLGAEPAAPADGHPANIDPSATPDLGPCYQCELAPFLLSKTEMTQAQWQRHTGSNPSNYKTDSDLTEQPSLSHPIEQISWLDADRVLREFDLALPTEAQWEWAYRALTHTAFPYGDDVRKLSGHENLADAHAKAHQGSPLWPYAEWLDDGFTVHAPVAHFLPNGFGLHDMGGNVDEWCADTWEDYADVAPRAGAGLRWGTHTKYRVVRGGSYAERADNARAAYRTGMPAHVSAAQCGVRPARPLQ